MSPATPDTRPTDLIKHMATTAQKPPFEVVPPITRYTDAYHMAKVLVRLGATLKILAIALGGGIAAVSGLIVLVSLAGINRSPAAIAGIGLGAIGFFVGILIGVLIFLFGVHLSAQGQLLRATLDTAVNSSPFLTDTEKSQAMSLRVSGT